MLKIHILEAVCKQKHPQGVTDRSVVRAHSTELQPYIIQREQWMVWVKQHHSPKIRHQISLIWKLSSEHAVLPTENK